MSLVLTPEQIYTLDNSNHHSDIIEEYKLRDNPHKILKVEIVPPSDNIAASASKWTLECDQDIFPSWHTDDPKATEKRIRRYVTGWMKTRPWWEKAAEIIEEWKTFPFSKPDGNPDSSWKLFLSPTWAAARAAAGDAVRDAAWDAALDAVRAAARAAVRDAARDAAGDTVRAAARAAVRDAAWAAAWAAARDAAGDAAWAAARDAERDVAGDAAWDAALAATRAAVRAAAGDAVFRGICSDLKLNQKHHNHIAARTNVWRKGYAVLCDVDGQLYVYGKK